MWAGSKGTKPFHSHIFSSCWHTTAYCANPPNLPYISCPAAVISCSIFCAQGTLACGGGETNEQGSKGCQVSHAGHVHVFQHESVQSPFTWGQGLEKLSAHTQTGCWLCHVHTAVGKHSMTIFFRSDAHGVRHVWSLYGYYVNYVGSNSHNQLLQVP